MTRPPALCQNKEWLYQKYIVERLSTPKIAEIIGCQQETVAKALKRLDIPIRIGSEAHSGDLHWHTGKATPQSTKDKISKSVTALGGYKDKRPEQCKKHSIDMTGPKNPRYKIHPSDEQIAQQIETLCDTNDNMTIVERKTKYGHPGEEHGNWRGGLPYRHATYIELQEDVRDHFGRKCFTCDKNEQENGNRLDTHTTDYLRIILDYDDRERQWHVIPLCNSCHSRTNFNRWYWFNLLDHHWAMNPSIDFNVQYYPIVSIGDRHAN